MTGHAPSSAAGTSDNSPPSPAISREGWHAFVLISTVQALSLLDRNILSILAGDIKRDLAIGDAELGMLYGTVFALFYALFSLPLGRLADGWIRTRLLAISIAVWSLSTGLAAFASGFTTLALSRLGVGVGEAAAQPAGTSLIYDHFPPARRGLAMAGLAAAISVGLGLSLMLGGLMAELWDASFRDSQAPLGLAGWQFAFVVAAAPGFIVAILLWRMREPDRGVLDGATAPEDERPFRASANVLGAILPISNWILLRRAGVGRSIWFANIAGLFAILAVCWGLAVLASSLAPRPALQLSNWSIDPHYLQWGIVGFGSYALLNLAHSMRQSDPPAFALLTSPSVLIGMVVGSLQSVINYGIMGFTPLFIMQEYDVSASETGLRFGIVVAVLGIFGPLISGPVSDWAHSRRPNRGRLWVVIFSLGLSPIPGYFTYTAPDTLSFYTWFVIHALLLTMWLPPFYAVLMELVLPRMRAITMSTYLVTYTILGLGIGPYTVGMVSDANDGDLGTAILSIFTVSPVIVVLLFVMLKTVPRDFDLIAPRAKQAGEVR